MENQPKPAPKPPDLAATPKSRPTTRAAPTRTRAPRFDEIPLPDIANPLAINRYTHQVLAVSLQQVVSDPSITEDERRKQISEIAGRMAPLTPQSTMAAAIGKLGVASDGRASGPGPQRVPARVSSPDASHDPAGDPATSGDGAIRGKRRV